MFTVLNCMPYVLAWPLNEQCNWACLKNMEQVVHSFYTAKEKGRRGIHLVPEEQVQLLTQSCFKKCFDSVWSQHLVKSQLVSDMQVKTHLLLFFFFFLLLLSPLLGPILPLHGGMGASSFSFQPLTWLSLILSKEWRGSPAEATLEAGWYSKGYADMWIFKGYALPCPGN